jgi:hypothetical protein
MAPGETLSFDGGEISDEQLQSLRNETRLHTLVIWGGSLSIERLEPIGRLTWLKGLVLGEMPIDDGVFRHLVPLRDLDYLNLAYTNIQGDFTPLVGLPLRDVRLEGCRRVGDTCAGTLAGFPTLRNLEIHMTGLTDRGLEYFAGDDLEVLWLGPRITDAGMNTVGTLRRLKHLDVCAHLVTDEGVRPLAGLHLEVLWLTGCRITDESVDPISRMKTLRELNLARTEVTPEGIARLRQALPDCRILDAD